MSKPFENTPVAKALLNLYQRDGFLQASRVVEEARDSESPLHTQFEWDDTIAAKKHRLQTARSLIRKVEIQVPEQEPQRFYHVRVTECESSGEDKRREGYYRILSEIVERPDECEIALQELRVKIRSLMYTTMELEKAMIRAGKDSSVLNPILTSTKTLSSMADGLQ